MNIVGQIMSLVLSLLTKEQAKELIDQLFDFIEAKVEDSETKWDDTLILPLINKAREALDVPDND